MKMHPDDFRRALEIITTNNRIAGSFNTPVSGNHADTDPLLIHESNAVVLHWLHDEGFSRLMTKKGSSITKH